MKKLRKLLYIGSVNLAIFVGLLFTANLLAAIAIDVRADKWFDPDHRWKLPNYSDKATAKLLFDEFNSLSSVYKTYVGWTRREFRGRTTTINADGDRVHPATTDRSQGVVRFFGGSTMWGTGSDDDGTIPAQFNQLFKEYRVYNHGEAGFVSRQSLARLITLATTEQPLDLVVFYDGVNDVQHFCSSHATLDSHGQSAEIADRMIGLRVLEMTFGNVVDAVEALQSKFNLLRLDDRPRSSRCETDPEHAKRVANLMLNNWQIAHRIVTDRGGQFVAVLQPVIYLGDPKHDYLEVPMKSASARTYRLMYSLFKAKIQDLNVDWIYDFTDVFDRDEPIYIDFCHVSENGNRLVAERLATFVQPNLPQVGAGAQLR